MAIPIYKMARKPVPPQHVEATAPSSGPIMIGDIKVPIIDYASSLPNTYQERSKSHDYYSETYYHLRNMSSGQIKTATSELADFLKSSKPEDFGSPAVNALVDDLSTSSHQKKRRFLRSSTPHNTLEKVRTQSPLPFPFRPPHVTPKTTSKGSHYLQIQVDYGNDGNKSGQPLKEVNEKALPVPKPDTTSIGVHKAGTEGDNFPSTPPRQQPFMNTSPPPWSPPFSNQSTAGAMVSYYNPLQGSPAPVSKPQRRTPVLPTLKTDFGRPQPKILQVDHIPRTLHTPTIEFEAPNRASLVSGETGLYYTPSGQQESPSRKENDSSRRCSEEKVVCTVVQPETGVCPNRTSQTKHTHMRKLAKPGPPPNRALPRLPELHDIPTLSGRPVVPYQVVHNTNSQVLPEKSEATTNDRKSREERVKARKARDMKVMQQKRLQEAIRLLDTVAAEAKGRTTPVQRGTSPTGSSSASIQTNRHSSQSLVENPPNRTTDARLKGSVTPPQQKNHRQMIKHEAPTPPRSPSPGFNPTASDDADSKPFRGRRLVTPTENLRSLLEESLIRQTELEDRLESMEHKYMILEQALITVLQRTSPHRSESHSIENLLADFRITHPCRGWSEAFPLERDLSQTEH